MNWLERSQFTVLTSLRGYRPHYGEEFRFDCIDASTDDVIACALLSTQQLLQMQRDEAMTKSGASVLQFLRGPVVGGEMRTLKLVLREGVKGAFGLNFCIPLEEPSLSQTKDAQLKGRYAKGCRKFEIHDTI